MKNQKCCRLHCDDDSNIYTSSSKALNKGILMLDNKWQSNRRYKKRRYKKYRLDRNRIGPDQYVFYSILNTDVVMEPRVAARLIACSILMLHKKLETDKAKRQYIREWEKSGKNIIILRGYNNKHLKYLERETKYTALDNQAIQLYHSQIMLVLSVFGRKGDIEEIFDGIPVL